MKYQHGKRQRLCYICNERSYYIVFDYEFEIDRRKSCWTEHYVYHSAAQSVIICWEVGWKNARLFIQGLGTIKAEKEFFGPLQTH